MMSTVNIPTRHDFDTVVTASNEIAAWLDYAMQRDLDDRTIESLTVAIELLNDAAEAYRKAVVR